MASVVWGVAVLAASAVFLLCAHHVGFFGGGEKDKSKEGSDRHLSAEEKQQKEEVEGILEGLSAQDILHAYTS